MLYNMVCYWHPPPKSLHKTMGLLTDRPTKAVQTHDKADAIK